MSLRLTVPYFSLLMLNSWRNQSITLSYLRGDTFGGVLKSPSVPLLEPKVSDLFLHSTFWKKTTHSSDRTPLRQRRPPQRWRPTPPPQPSWRWTTAITDLLFWVKQIEKDLFPDYPRGVTSTKQEVYIIVKNLPTISFFYVSKKVGFLWRPFSSRRRLHVASYYNKKFCGGQDGRGKLP